MLDMCENPLYPQATGRSNYSIAIANADLEPMEDDAEQVVDVWAEP